MLGRHRKLLVAALATGVVGAQFALAPTSEAAKACAPVIFIGVRGSGELQSDNQGFGKSVQPLLTEFRRRLNQNGVNVRALAINYPAAHPEVIYKHILTGTDEFLGSIYEGLEEFEATLQAEAFRCPTSMFALAGYSQGAMIVHLALTHLHDSFQTSLLARIASVSLLSDPLRRGGAETHLGYASAVTNGIAIYGAWTGINTTEVPTEVRSRTKSTCVNYDIVCATDPSMFLPVRLWLGQLNAEIAVRIHEDAYRSQWAKITGQQSADIALAWLRSTVPSDGSSYTFHGVQCTANVNGQILTQSHDITLSYIVPDQVAPGETFTITFPGTPTVLPTTAGGFPIVSFSNMSWTYGVGGSRFNDGSIVNSGTATWQPTSGGAAVLTPQTAELTTANPIKIAVPGPVQPGTLTTSTVSVQVTAPASGAVTLHGVQVTTSSISGPGGLFNTAVTCYLPTSPPIATIPVVGGGSTTSTIPVT